MDPLESVIEPSVIVSVPAAVESQTIFPSVIATPASWALAVLSVPVVVRFSLPNEIAPLESVMDPLASVRLPTVVPVAAVSTPQLSVPVVLRFSLSNEMAPLESVIDALASVRLPVVIVEAVRELV